MKSRHPFRTSFIVFFLGASAVACAAFCAAGTATDPGDGTVVSAGEIVRADGPEGLSAISHLEGDRYWTVDDEGGRLLLVRIPLDSATGSPKGWEVVSEFAVPGVSDLEGVAADPLAPAVAWVADERSRRIVGYDTVSNRVVSTVTLPAFAGDADKNRGVESLAISPDGLALWTCLEGPLDADGPFVRLVRFVRGSGAEAWRLSGVWAVPFEWQARKIKKISFRVSVSELAVLSDGRLVMLELAKTKVKKVRTGKIVLSVIDIGGATDVSASAIPAGDGFKAAVKRRLFTMDAGLALYEGLAEGPRLADGAGTLLLVSDAEKGGERKVLSLRVASSSAENNSNEGSLK